MLSFLYGPTVTPVHDNWKNHSFDCMDLSQQSDVILNMTTSMGLPCGPVTDSALLMQRGPGSVPGQGTRSHMPELKILRATTKMEDPACINQVFPVIMCGCENCTIKKAER